MGYRTWREVALLRRGYAGFKGGRREVFGPLRPTLAHPGVPLRGWMVVRLCGGIREREGERAEGAREREDRSWELGKF